MVIEIVDLPINSMVMFHRILPMDHIVGPRLSAHCGIQHPSCAILPGRGWADQCTRAETVASVASGLPNDGLLDINQRNMAVGINVLYCTILYYIE